MSYSCSSVARCSRPRRRLRRRADRPARARDAGYAAVEAADGAAAFAACEERDPDVVLLDLSLPRLGGHAFVDAYRRGMGHAKIIIMSGAERGGERSARIHAATYLSKPFELEQLLVAVKRVLNPAPA